MTTLYLRHPAKVNVDDAAAGSVPVCQFALAGDGGDLLQQGAAALDSLTDLVASARRVVVLLAAADVTLLRVKLPPLSPARLKLALPNLVEDQILGDPDACVLVAGPALDGDGMRSVAVVQRQWLENLVKTLLAQGARSVSAVPAQLCLPLQPGLLAAALTTENNGLQLTLRLGPYEGMGLSLPSQPLAALQTVRTFAGEALVTLYLPLDQAEVYQALSVDVPGITIEADHWANWINGAHNAGIDMVPAMGASGTQARDWQRWRWPLRLAVLIVLVNVAGMNVEYAGLKRDVANLRASMLQTFKAVYPNEAPIYPVEQMRRNIATAKLNSGQIAADDFTALTAAFGEALNVLPAKGVIASLEYRERMLLVKPKPDSVDANAVASIKTALAARNLQLTEPTPGIWQIRVGTASAAGGKS